MDSETAGLAGILGRFRTLKPQDADLTVFAPPVAAPNSEILVQIIIHTPDREAEARSRALKIEPTAEELASTPLTIQLNRNDDIKITFDCEDAKVSEPVQNIRWNGRIVCLYFMIRLPDTKSVMYLVPKLRVFINSIPAGSIVFRIKVAPFASDLPLAFAQQEGRAFEWAFVSYAHEDRVEVLKAAQLMSALRIRYFQDLLSASPGDRWRERLFSEIERCDVFLLFWSKHAQESEWVIKEAEYALRCAKSSPADRPLEIVPVLLEGPPPPPPPDSLREIHFNDPIRYVIFAEESVAKEHSVTRLESSNPRGLLNQRPIDIRGDQQPATTPAGTRPTIVDFAGTQPTMAMGEDPRKSNVTTRVVESIGPTAATLVVLAVIIVLVNLFRYWP